MTGGSTQSTFVTVVAWLVLIFSGMSALAGLMQSVMVAALDPFPPVSPEEAATMPRLTLLLFNNFRAFVWGLTAVYAMTFAAGLGVLRRKEWARQLLIAIFSIAAVGSAAMAAVMQVVMNETFQGATDAPPDARTMMMAIRAFSVIFAVVFAGAFGWLAYKFTTPAVRAEFS
jgi:hypothetical protein